MIKSLPIMFELFQCNYICMYKFILVKGQWSEWSEVGQCSRRCGGGVQIQTRTCEGQLNEGGNCPGKATKESKCNETPCDSTYIQ